MLARSIARPRKQSSIPRPAVAKAAKQKIKFIHLKMKPHLVPPKRPCDVCFSFDIYLYRIEGHLLSSSGSSQPKSLLELVRLVCMDHRLQLHPVLLGTRSKIRLGMST